jgi:hypothetical protein
VGWRYEEEYQLVLDSDTMGSRVPESRMLPHHFAYQSGVTFGTWLPMNAKSEIGRIIEEKAPQGRGALTSSSSKSFACDRPERSSTPKIEFVRLGPPARYSPSNLQGTHAGMGRVGPLVRPSMQLQCR